MKIEVLTNDERESFTALLGKDLIVGIKPSNRDVFSSLICPCIGFTHHLSSYLHWKGGGGGYHLEVLLAHHQNRISEKWYINVLPELILYVLPEINCKLLILIEN